MTTRTDYMLGLVTHEEYYRAVNATAGVTFSGADPTFLDWCQVALDSGDEHLNSIPLNIWDARGASVYSYSRAFKFHGDIDTMAGRACAVKQAAKDAVVMRRTQS